MALHDQEVCFEGVRLKALHTAMVAIALKIRFT